MKFRIFSVIILSFISASLFSQDENNERPKGFVTAGYETNTIYYLNDSISGAVVPDGSFGTNNYLKVDFTYGKFTAGTQFEFYLPAVQGYPTELKNSAFTSIYAAFQDKGFSVRAGDFFEQFGSGLLYRSWEDRTLGLNTGLQGINAAYSYKDIVTIRGIYGRQRYFMEYSDTWIRGADLIFSLSNACNWNWGNLSLEGSFINKYEPLQSESQKNLGATTDVSGYSARINLDSHGFLFKGEIIQRDGDCGPYNYYADSARASAYLIELGYSNKGFGAMLSLRKIKNMMLQSKRDENRMFTMVNYIPALTQQHSYSLANLNPYQAQAADEKGGQLDLYYNVKKGTKLGGKKGLKLHLNTSMWYGPTNDPVSITDINHPEDVLYYRDLTFDVEHWFGSKFKMILFYSWQTYNPLVKGHLSEEWSSHIVVADLTYKFNRKNSLRGEFQHSYSQDDQGSWVAASLEYTIAPKWSFNIADMWNYGDTHIHYYNGGISYSYSKVRCALNFGRFKEGYQCSGGVCRIIPAYTGANFTLTITY